MAVFTFCNLYSETVVSTYFVIERQTSNHSLVVPGDFYINYNDVNYFYIQQHPSGSVNQSYLVKVWCSGNGPDICPSFCDFWFSLGRKIFPDAGKEVDFMSESSKMMETHAITQYFLGNKEGYASFNTVYNGYQIIRNVTWKITESTSDIKINILPANY